MTIYDKKNKKIFFAKRNVIIYNVPRQKKIICNDDNDIQVEKFSRTKYFSKGGGGSQGSWKGPLVFI